MSGGGERSGREGTESEGGREEEERWGKPGGGREAPRSAAHSVLQTRAGRFPGSWAVRVSALLQQPLPEGAGKRGLRPVGQGAASPPSKPPAKCLGRHNQAACSAEQATRPGAERAHWVGWERLLADAGALGSGLGLTMLLRDRVAGHKRIPGLPPPRRARISCSWLPGI